MSCPINALNGNVLMGQDTIRGTGMSLRSHQARQFRTFRTDVPALPLHQALLPELAGQHLLISVDMLNAGVHFDPTDDPSGVGHKALAVNLSDLAAMGAQARWASLALRLPPALAASWLAGFRAGFDSLAQSYGVVLSAVDFSDGPLAVTIEALGTAPAGASLRRAGARAGDRIFVSGTLGDAAFALRQRLAGERVKTDQQSWLQQRLDRPQPRLELGMLLRGFASSAIDVSDGLVSDLGHVLKASGVGASLQAVRLPLSEALLRCAAPEQAVDCALSGGDDYELCFTVPPDRVQDMCDAMRACGSRVTEVGEITARPGLRVLDADGAEVTSVRRGYDHFVL